MKTPKEKHDQFMNSCLAATKYLGEEVLNRKHILYLNLGEGRIYGNEDFEYKFKDRATCAWVRIEPCSDGSFLINSNFKIYPKTIETATYTQVTMAEILTHRIDNDTYEPLSDWFMTSSDKPEPKQKPRRKIPLNYAIPVIILALLTALVFIVASCSDKPKGAFNSPPVKMKRVETQEQTMYRYPDGSTGSLPFNRWTGEKGEEIVK